MMSVLISNQAFFSSLQTDTFNFQSFEWGHLLCQTESLDLFFLGLTGQPPLTRTEGTRTLRVWYLASNPVTSAVGQFKQQCPAQNGQEEVTHLTVLPSITQRTYTSICAQAVHARAFVQARMRITLINFREAEGSCKPHRTLASKGIDPIHTSTSIETGAARE